MSAIHEASQNDASPLRDRNGLTEQEFLAAYKEKDYPKPSLTADICVFRRTADKLELLLVQRGGHPYLGCWALPGGFVKKGEDADTAAARELAEETGVNDLALEQIGFFSTPGRDPRGWIVSEAYLSFDEAGQAVCAGDDAAKAAWFTLRREDAQDSGEAGMLKDGTQVEISLTHGDVRLSAAFIARKQPASGRFRSEVIAAEGFAFDHACIASDAYLALLR